MAAGMLDAGVDIGRNSSDKCNTFLTSQVYRDVRKMQQTPDEVAAGLAAFMDSLSLPPSLFRATLDTSEEDTPLMLAPHRTEGFSQSQVSRYSCLQRAVAPIFRLRYGLAFRRHCHPKAHVG
jgi:hypothetical protein